MDKQRIKNLIREITTEVINEMNDEQEERSLAQKRERDLDTARRLVSRIRKELDQKTKSLNKDEAIEYLMLSAYYAGKENGRAGGKWPDDYGR